MKLKIGQPILDDYAHVARRLSDDDRSQYLLATGAEEYVPDEAARRFAAMGGMQWVVVDELPIAILGCYEILPGTWQTWTVTVADAFDRHGRELTVVARRVMDEVLNGPDVRRLQTVTLASRIRARNWYEKAMRMTCEGVKRAYYPGGLDAVEYARVGD